MNFNVLETKILRALELDLECMLISILNKDYRSRGIIQETYYKVFYSTKSIEFYGKISKNKPQPDSTSDGGHPISF